VVMIGFALGTDVNVDGLAEGYNDSVVGLAVGSGIAVGLAEGLDVIVDGLALGSNVLMVGAEEGSDVVMVGGIVGL